MAIFFIFEADFVESLRCIPMQARYTLDSCGIKLKLTDWHRMTQNERQALLDMPCKSENEVQAYREYLQNLIFNYTGKIPSELPIEDYPAWLNVDKISEEVEAKASEFGVTISLQQWALLSPLQRFALIKLSRSGHENKNFPKALEEFNLVDL
ncbi:nitrate reductase associated protein [Brunnivagina elsteri]|uniref:Nitrate reductase associated protein n=1 Tax=Brunnivagina elsteri CCALA 953 TaxID=987040 RepID=A0A2A2TLN4_9CYAN|nr:nitrate reductase associated protein [Calothrix elsteri]PAX58417.1 nitrate reductase associated protein [Calothrix elsteri CCALA 953]